jgi:DNA polymerase-3 subunit alpha
LIHAGAFDCLGARRSQLLLILPRAIQAGQAKQDDRRRGQLGLFDEMESAAHNHSTANGNGHVGSLDTLPDVPELPDVERLASEKKALGFYMSSHPLTRHAQLLYALASHDVADLAMTADKTEVILGGMITNVQLRNVQKSRSGLTRMAKLTFEDLTGSTPAMLWPEEFAKMADLVKNDSVVWVKGTLDRRRDPPELVISKIIPHENGPAELPRGVIVRLQKASHRLEHLERLLRAVRIRPGNLDLYFEIVGLEQIHRAIYKAGPALKVRYDDKLIPELEGAVGSGQVRLLGPRGATARIDAGTTAVAEVLSPSRPAPPRGSGLDSDLDDAADLDQED